MRLPICYYGNPVLRKKAQPVCEINAEVRQLASDMIETMIAFEGVGLAAPQVGKLLRMYVFRDEQIDVEGRYSLGPAQVAINPILSDPSDEMEEMVEGCLSIPEVHLPIMRPKKIHIVYRNLDDELIEQDFLGFLARVNMHENDHLNGVLHIDRASAKDRKAVQKILKKIKAKNS